jgi:hypothetical protein
VSKLHFGAAGAAAIAAAGLAQAAEIAAPAPVETACQGAAPAAIDPGGAGPATDDVTLVFACPGQPASQV